MDGNSMHTSVVIKLPDEEKPDDVKTYKIDLEDVEASKEYVIDQLFCDDEIAVYAMFEASNFANEKSQNNLRKVSCSNFGEFRFSQRRSFTKRKDEKTRQVKAKMLDSKEEPAALLKYRTDNSICPQNKEISDREENFSGIEKTKKCVKLKSTSKGVNTDIDQNPKLLEEVWKAIGLNFSKLNEKNTEFSSFFSEKSSHDVKEVITRASSTTFSLDGKNGKLGEKLSPNVVIVPVIIKNEELYNFLRDDKSQQSQSFDPSLGSKTSVVHKKVSVSTSTQLFLPQEKNNEVIEPETLQNKPHSNGTTDEEKEKSKPQEFLLEEIKNLQEKFNSLLKSLESIGFTFVGKKEPKDVTSEPKESKPVCKSLNKFDEIPIFSPEIRVFSEFKNCNEKTTDNETEGEVPPIKIEASNSEDFPKDPIDNTKMLGKCSEEEKLHLSELINWKELQNHKEAQQSKSQTNIRCVESKNTNLKKSLSLDLGRESIGSKKLENTLLKLEGRVKKKSKTLRVNEEFGFVDKLNEAKLHESPKLGSLEVKAAINDSAVKAAANGLLKIQKSLLNKGLEKGITEKLTLNRMLTRTTNADTGDVKDTKLTKKAGPRSKITETVKVETKTIPSQEKKQNSKSIIRRVSVKDSPQSKLHVNLLIKSQQNCEQKKNIPVKCNSTRLPRASFQKKDETIAKKEKKPEVFTASKISVKKNLEPEEMKIEKGSPEEAQPTTTSMVVLELFSKKPNSMEDFNSEVDLQSQYSVDMDAKENCGSGGNDGLNDCQNPVIKSVWALKKVFLYEDGKKKMEVLEASPNPPDYFLNQNSTEDKIR